MERDRLLQFKGAEPIAIANALNVGELSREEWRLIIQLNKTNSWDRLDDFLPEGFTTTKISAPKNSVVKSGAPKTTTPEISVVRPVASQSEGKAKEVSQRGKATLQDHIIIEREYYRVADAISDVLYETLKLSPAEQSVYNRLYRLSFGFGRNWCQVGASALMKSCQLRSQATVLKTIHALMKKKCIKITKEASNNPKGTLYRVFLPSEIAEVIQTFPELTSNTTIKISAPENSAVKSSAPENSALIFEETTTKNSALKNDVVQEDSDTARDSEATTKISALIFDGNIVHDFIQFNSTLSRDEIIEKFYRHINQSKISKKERERASKIYNSLKKEDFTEEEIVFAVNWTIQNVKDVRSFVILEHTIGQALSEREKILEQQAQEEKAEARRQELQRREEARRATETLAEQERQQRREASPWKETWEQIAEYLSQQMLRQSFHTWIQPLFITELHDTAVVIDCPSRFIKEYVEKEYRSLIEKAVTTVCGEEKHVIFVCAEEVQQ